MLPWGHILAVVIVIDPVSDLAAIAAVSANIVSKITNGLAFAVKTPPPAAKAHPIQHWV
jgi:hypothetical protein